MSDYIMTAAEFVEKLHMCADLPSLYVKGGFGHCASDYNKQRLINQYSYNARRADMINAAPRDAFFYDCCGLGKAIAWGFAGNPDLVYGGAVYQSNGVPDEDEQAMMDSCYDISTVFSEILLGEALGIPGHIGYYIGNGYAIEASPSGKNGVQITSVGNIKHRSGEPERIWYRHGRLPFIDYEQPVPPEPPKPKRVDEDGSWGPQVTFALQQIFGTAIWDGIVSGQPNGNRKYLPNCASPQSWQFEFWPWKQVGSDLIYAMQVRLAGLGYYTGAWDRWCGPLMVEAIQLWLRDLGYYDGEIDRSLGPATALALQRWINAQ